MLLKVANMVRSLTLVDRLPQIKTKLESHHSLLHMEEILKVSCHHTANFLSLESLKLCILLKTTTVSF